MENRIVTLIDMDCFYCQVETRLNPSLKGKPVAVVQYNTWMGGGIIAVNYEARDRGVTRHMRGDEAKKHCPEIELVSVPSVRGKADLTKYRDAGREVAAVLCEFSKCVEKASIDEAYIDITDIVNQRSADNIIVTGDQLMNTFIVGFTSQDNNNEDERKSGVISWLNNTYSDELIDPKLKRLAIAALIVEEMRATIYNKTGFRSSAGIAHNKILAKLVCGLHKPNRQTVLPLSGLTELYQTLPIKKVRSLGGKLGDDVKERLHVAVMADLLKFSENELQSHYGAKTGTWLFNIARGVDLEPVTPRLISNSIGCCKKFPGRNALSTKQSVEHWLSELVAEVAERLEEDITMNKRKAQLLTVSVQQDQNGHGGSVSRSAPLPGYEPEKITACAMAILNRMNSTPESSCLWVPALKYLGLSASKFIDHRGSTSLSINQFFRNSESQSTNSCTETLKDNKNLPDSSACTRQENYTQNVKNRCNSFIGNYFRITNCGSAVRECKEQDTKSECTKDEEKPKSPYEYSCASANQINGEVSSQIMNNKKDCEKMTKDKENQQSKGEKHESSFFERYLKNKFMKFNNDITTKRNGVYIPDEVADCLFPKSDVLSSSNSIIQEHGNTNNYTHGEHKNTDKSVNLKTPLLSLSNIEIVENEVNNADIEKEEEEETVSRYFNKNNNSTTNTAPVTTSATVPVNTTTNITSTTTGTTTTAKNNNNNTIDSSSSSNNVNRVKEINENVEVHDENIEVWISPSEIFPDLDNIDEDTLSLLPSPLRREVLLKKKNKESYEPTLSCDNSSTNMTQVNHRISHNFVHNRFSDFSNASSCEVEPSTELQIVASVHVAEEEYLRSLEQGTENKVLNQHNNCDNSRTENIDLNNSCVDIFAGIEGENSIHSYKSVTAENESHPREVTEICVHCGNQILLIDMPEHLDHHIAMDLHKELNSGKLPVRTVISKDSSKKKRGRPEKKNNIVGSPRKKFKTISSFFSHR